MLLSQILQSDADPVVELYRELLLKRKSCGNLQKLDSIRLKVFEI